METVISSRIEPAYSRSVIVSNIPDGVTLNELELHFLRSRNGGAGDVESVKWIRRPGIESRPGAALLTFSKEDTVSRVCSIKQILQESVRTSDSLENIQESVLVTHLLKELTSPCTISFPSAGVRFLQEVHNITPSEIFKIGENIEIASDASNNLLIKCNSPTDVPICHNLYLNALLSSDDSAGDGSNKNLNSDTLLLKLFESEFHSTCDHERLSTSDYSPDSGVEMLTNENTNDSTSHKHLMVVEDDILTNRVSENRYLTSISSCSEAANVDSISRSPTSIDGEGDCELSGSFNESVESEELPVSRLPANQIENDKIGVSSISEIEFFSDTNHHNLLDKDVHVKSAIKYSSSESDDREPCKVYNNSELLTNLTPNQDSRLVRSRTSSLDVSLGQIVQNSVEIYRHSNSLKRYQMNTKRKRSSLKILEHKVDGVNSSKNEDSNGNFNTKFDESDLKEIFLNGLGSDKNNSQSVADKKISIHMGNKNVYDFSETLSKDTHGDSETNKDNLASAMLIQQEIWPLKPMTQEIINNSSAAYFERSAKSYSFDQSKSECDNPPDLDSSSLKRINFYSDAKLFDYHAEKFQTIENIAAIEETLKLFITFNALETSWNKDVGNIDVDSSLIGNDSESDDRSSSSSSKINDSNRNKNGNTDKNIGNRSENADENVINSNNSDSEFEVRDHCSNKPRFGNANPAPETELSKIFSQSFDERSSRFWWEVVPGAFKLYFEFNIGGFELLTAATRWEAQKMRQGPRVFHHAFLPRTDRALKVISLIERAFNEGLLFKNAGGNGLERQLRGGKNPRVGWNGVDMVEFIQDARLRNPRKREAFLDKLVCQLSTLLEAATSPE